MANKTDKSGDDPKSELLKELRKLIKQLDAEELAFLVRQANTMIYNRKVDELNRKNEEVNKYLTKSGSQNTDEGRRKGNNQNASFSIERGSFGRSFIFVFPNVRKTVDEHEMVKLVNIAHKSSSSADGAERIYTWLNRFRDDILLDTGAGKKSGIWKDVYAYLKENYNVG